MLLDTIFTGHVWISRSFFFCFRWLEQPFYVPSLKLTCLQGSYVAALFVHRLYLMIKYSSNFWLLHCCLCWAQRRPCVSPCYQVTTGLRLHSWQLFVQMTPDCLLRWHLETPKISACLSGIYFLSWNNLLFKKNSILDIFADIILRVDAPRLLFYQQLCVKHVGMFKKDLFMLGKLLVSDLISGVFIVCVCLCVLQSRPWWYC